MHGVELLIKGTDVHFQCPERGVHRANANQLVHFYKVHFLGALTENTGDDLEQIFVASGRHAGNSLGALIATLWHDELALIGAPDHYDRLERLPRNLECYVKEGTHPAWTGIYVHNAPRGAPGSAFFSADSCAYGMNALQLFNLYRERHGSVSANSNALAYIFVANSGRSLADLFSSETDETLKALSSPAKGYCIATVQKRLEERKATYEKELAALAAIEEAVTAVATLKAAVEAKKASVMARANEYL